MAKRKKTEKKKCVFPGCLGAPRNHLGLRLRRPPEMNAIWAHDTDAYICDEHAEMGLAFIVNVALHSNGKKIYSAVSHDDGETFSQESKINPEKSPSARSR